MASNFNSSKYKQLFEQRFGKGSYDAGLSKAREIGATKAQAAFAKQEADARLKALKKAQEEYLKQLEEQETYGGVSKETFEVRLKEQGKITAQQEKAQAQGRGGHLPTRENQMKEKKKTDSAKVDITKLTPYQKQKRGLTPSWDEKKDDKKKKSVLGKIGDFLTSKDVDNDGERDGLLGAIDRFVVPISKGATDSIIPGNTERMSKNNPDNPVVKAAQKDRGLETDILNAAGMIGAFAAPYSGAYKAANLAVNKVPKLANIANPYAKKAVTGALAGGMAEAGISATNELANSEANDMRDYAIRTGLGIAGGAILDPALHGIANIIKRGRVPKGNTSEESLLGLPEPQKALPEPQLRLSEPRKVTPSLDALNNTFKRPTGLNNPIPPMPKALSQPLTRNRLESQGLNFGFNTKNAPQARKDLSPVTASIDPMNRNQAYWQGRYEEFAKQVNARHDLNSLTPEALEDLWSSFARYDEPVKLEDVVDLAYPKGFEAPPVVKEPARTIKDDLKEDPRINDMVKGLFPKVNSEPKISRPANLDEMVRRLEEIAPKKGQQSQGTPDVTERLLQRLNPEAAAAVEQVKPTSEKIKAGKDFEAIEPAMVESEPPLLRADDPITDMTFDPKKMKDISGFKAATTDVYRIFRDAFGKDYETVGKPIVNKLDSAKGQYVNMQQQWLNKLKTEVVDKLGIKKGSKESALVQRYGEKKMTLDELKAASPDKWKDIVKADQWFRQSYDNIYEGVNKARQTAYPNSPDKQVPKLDNYYRHFREMNGLTGLKNIFDSPSQIDPHLAGMSQHTNPSSKWHSFMQKRGMGPYKEDAVGGFLEYIPGASFATNIDPVIPVFKNLRRQLADGTEDSRNINNFIEFLYNYSNDLAGKTNPYFDRNLQQLVGRKTMSVLNWVNNRVKKNVILGNVGSVLAQMANIPNGVAFAKQYSVKGASRTLTSIFDKNAPIHKSDFLKERYLGKLFREFDQRLIDQPEKLAGWLIETTDRVGSSFVWNSVYEKGLKQGVQNPIKYADDETRKLIAGRGVGEVPLLQKAKTTQLVMPFTLEVANLWKVIGDMGKKKDFGGIATLFVANYILNKGMEETRGSAVTFDPIDALADALGNDELSNTQKAGRVVGEVLTNVPLGQHIAGLYPEYGEVLNIKGPTRAELFGERDPQRFGTGLVAANSVNDALFKFALPFGGNQLKKTLSGIDAINNEGSYKKDSPVSIPMLGDNEKLKYPVDPNLWNNTKGLLFGAGAFNEARDYYDERRRPLSENQTAEYEDAKLTGTEQEYYKNLMSERKVKTIENKIKEVEKDKSLSDKEKMQKIMKYYQELQSLQ
ncbi:hypothetical protein [Bacillus infantis]|uniref:Large polyvalent protein associated domain-containing protein n=1 Tax=Bacillus infantis TaxID=324767 RepID=A0A5D4R828_9BACI|nr:hypothetical protein [Bacillus infantis]TYS46770.1 hypothetical protein FZD51_14960 [Bacillus infantis]